MTTTDTRSHTRKAHRCRGVLAATAVLGLALGVLAPAATSYGAPTAGAAPSDTVKAEDRAVAADAAAADKQKRYSPKRGAIVSNPLRPARRWVVRRHLLRSITSTPKGEKIRIATWNFDSTVLRQALVAADKRGVSVRLLMAHEVAMRQGPGGDFHLLVNALRANAAGRDEARRPAMRSWARTCISSCRGRGGILHSKLYLFSKVGKSKGVVMASSANFTDFAGSVQWADVYTVVNRPKTWWTWIRAYRQMAKDRPAKPPYVTETDGRKYQSIFFPYQPKRGADPVLRRLKPVTCTGAEDGYGVNGRTRIRIAQTAWLDDRGLAIAKRVRQLYNQGCDIKIVYAVAKEKVLGPLRNTKRGPIPIRQVVQDFDGDGVFDRYLHTKLMSISGVYREDTSARYSWNGSENWTRVAANSDEAGLRVRGKVERKYARYIDGLFAHPPRSVPLRPGLRRADIDPYAKIEIN